VGSSAGSRSRAQRSASAAGGRLVAFQTPARTGCSLSTRARGGVDVCPCHASEFDLRTVTSSATGARAAPDLRGARSRPRAAGALGPPPAAAEAVHGGGSRLPGRRPHANAAGPPRSRAPCSTIVDSRTWVSGAVECRTSVDAAASRGAAFGNRSGGALLGVHPLRDIVGCRRIGRRTRSEVGGTSRGPDARGGRGAQVDARHRPQRTRACALSNKGFTRAW